MSLIHWPRDKIPGGDRLVESQKTLYIYCYLLYLVVYTKIQTKRIRICHPPSPFLFKRVSISAFTCQLSVESRSGLCWSIFSIVEIMHLDIELLTSRFHLWPLHPSCLADLYQASRYFYFKWTPRDCRGFTSHRGFNPKYDSLHLSPIDPMWVKAEEVAISGTLHYQGLIAFLVSYLLHFASTGRNQCYLLVAYPIAQDHFHQDMISLSLIQHSPFWSQGNDNTNIVCKICNSYIRPVWGS